MVQRSICTAPFGSRVAKCSKHTKFEKGYTYKNSSSKLKTRFVPKATIGYLIYSITYVVYNMGYVICNRTPL